MIFDDRIEAANKVLPFFANWTHISIDKSYLVVSWTDYKKAIISKRWMTRGQDFYPVWYRKWGHGGTACTALSQLIRWCKDKPVLSIKSWEYWGTEKYRLFRDNGENVIKILNDYNYPKEDKCVLCGKQPTSIDWWNLNGVSGPCCWGGVCRK